METDKNTGKLLHDYVDLLMLKLIHEHKLSKDIGNILFLSKGAVSKRIRRLEAHNYIVSKKVGIIREIDLTPEGNSLLEQFTNAGTPKSGNYQVNYLETHKIRIEALEFKVPLKERIKPFEKMPLLSGLNAKVINDRGYSEIIIEMDNNTYRITSKSMLFHLKERYITLQDDILKAYIQVMQELSSICNFFSQKGIQLQRYTKDRYKIHPLKTEIAFEHNEIANKSKDEKIPIKIFDKQDGKLRAEVDMSKGFPEFEFKHPKKSWSDGMNFTDTMQQLFDGRFQQFQNGVMEDIRMIVDNQKYFAENLSKHVKAIEELTKMAKGVQDYLKAEPLNTKKDLNWVEIRDGVEILR